MNFPDPLNPQSRETLTVALAARSYPIHIGAGLLDEAPALIRETLGAVRCIVITDSHVGPLYAGKLHAALARVGLAKDDPITLPAGEQTKNFSHLSFLLDQLFQKDIDRKTVLVALGGGVIGDLVGFTAAIALRGIDFVQIPTSLLAQVDSSVGGKTAINSPRGKNLIGAFHQPRMVITDVATLKTLPAREMKAGYAEIAKIALACDGAFFDWLEQYNGKALLAGDAQKQTEGIRKSCAMKADIVARDEKENNVRALLNLGHTFAHAFEQAAGYNGSLLHGEAVSLGLVKAFQLSEKLGHVTADAPARVIAHLADVGLPVSIKGKGWDVDRLIIAMHKDKKAADGKLTFVLAKGIGTGFVEKHVEAATVRAVLAE